MLRNHFRALRQSTRAYATIGGERDVVLVDACRTPFQMSGTCFYCRCSFRPILLRNGATCAAVCLRFENLIVIHVYFIFFYLGTGFKDLQGWQLARMALHGLAERNPLLDLETVDRVIYGNVIQEVCLRTPLLHCSVSMPTVRHSLFSSVSICFRRYFVRYLLRLQSLVTRFARRTSVARRRWRRTILARFL